MHLFLWSVPTPNLDVPLDRRIPISPITEDIPKDMIFLHPIPSLHGTTHVARDLRICGYQPHVSFPITIEGTIPPRKGGDHFDLFRYSLAVTRLEFENPASQPVDVTFTLKAKCALPAQCYPLSPFDLRYPFTVGYSSRDLRFRGSFCPSLCILSVIDPPSSEPRRLTDKHAALTFLHLNLKNHIDYATLCPSSGRSVFALGIEGGAVSVFVADYLSS